MEEKTKVVKIKEPQTYPWAVKDTRADFTYYPKVKELQDVMCLPNLKIQSEVDTFIKILDNYA